MSFIHTLLYDSHSSQLTHHPSKQQSASRNSFEFPLASSAPWKLHTMQCVCTTHCIIIKHTRFSFAKLKYQSATHYLCARNGPSERSKEVQREKSVLYLAKSFHAREPRFEVPASEWKKVVDGWKVGGWWWMKFIVGRTHIVLRGQFAIYKK